MIVRGKPKAEYQTQIVKFMGPTWALSAPDGPHIGNRNLAIGERWAIVNPANSITIENFYSVQLPLGHLLLNTTLYMAGTSPWQSV